MDRDQHMELTFAVHPRPAESDPLPPAAADHLLTGFSPETDGTAAEDVSHHDDTVPGDLAFLTRYALGRY